MENPYACNLAASSSWFTVSKAFGKFIKLSPQNPFLSKLDLGLFKRVNSAFCLLNPFPYPQRCGERKLPSYSFSLFFKIGVASANFSLLGKCLFSKIFPFQTQAKIGLPRSGTSFNQLVDIFLKAYYFCYQG